MHNKLFEIHKESCSVIIALLQLKLYSVYMKSLLLNFELVQILSMVVFCGSDNS